MAKPKSDLLQGTLDLLILKTLELEPMHGWGISQRIQQVSDSVLQVNQGSLLSLALAALLLIAGALRLSYFNTFGLSGTRFLGLPLSYDLPVLAILFLCRPAVPEGDFPTLVNSAMVALAALHVSTLRVPRTSGAFLAGVVTFSIAASAVLATRGLQ